MEGEQRTQIDHKSSYPPWIKVATEENWNNGAYHVRLRHWIVSKTVEQPGELKLAEENSFPSIAGGIYWS